jgi:hypothetical protein
MGLDHTILLILEQRTCQTYLSKNSAEYIPPRPCLPTVTPLLDCTMRLPQLVTVLVTLQNHDGWRAVLVSIPLSSGFSIPQTYRHAGPHESKTYSSAGAPFGNDNHTRPQNPRTRF